MSALVSLTVAFACAAALTPLVRYAACKCGLLDRPDPQRKLHRQPIPLGGGFAVFVATIVGAGVMVLIPGQVRQLIQQSRGDLLYFLAAGAVILVVGLADDRRVLRGRQKLAGQIIAVTLVVYSGLIIEHINLLGVSIDLGLLAVPFTFFWLLGATNALNLLDGADGFASTIGIIISGTIALLAASSGHAMEAVIAAALAGALLGFLIYNFPPSSIFLGDAGSMLIGLAVGVLAIRSALKGTATVALAAPLAVLAIPIFDATFAIARRWLTGRSLYTSDRGHLHHSLQRRGFGPRGILVGVALLCAVTAAGALISTYVQSEFYALASVGMVLAILVVSGVFGFRELVLVTNRALSFGSSLVTSRTAKYGAIREESVRLQGSRNWDELWNTLTDFAQQQQLNNVRLDLNVAWLHEGFHALWARNSESERADAWFMRLPLAANGRILGRLELAGAQTGKPMSDRLELVSEMLDTLEPCIHRLADELPTDELEDRVIPETVPVA